MRVFVVVLPRLAQDPQKLFCGLALPGPDALEDVGAGHRLAANDADLDFQVVDTGWRGSRLSAATASSRLAGICFSGRAKMF
jgi:hypothetical protein